MWDTVLSLAKAAFALGAIGVVFWFTFRRPPRRRSDEAPSSHDAEALLKSLRDGGESGPL